MNNSNDMTKEEPKCRLEQTLGRDTRNIGPLDTGSTFNSTNNENPLMNLKKAVSPIASRTNAGQRKMRTHGKIPELTEEMWLDEESMITIMSFAKLAD